MVEKRIVVSRERKDRLQKTKKVVDSRECWRKSKQTSRVFIQMERVESGTPNTPVFAWRFMRTLHTAAELAKSTFGSLRAFAASRQDEP